MLKTAYKTFMEVKSYADEKKIFFVQRKSLIQEANFPAVEKLAVLFKYSLKT